MKITVIGDGGWGTALALVLQGNGHDVTLWGPFEAYIEQMRETGENVTFLPGIALPPELHLTAEREAAGNGAEAIVMAVPTRFYREVATSFQPFVAPETPAVSVSKGLDPKTHVRMTEVAREALGCGTVAALSGPSHAEEVARGRPTAIVLASEDEQAAQTLQDAFASQRFRVYSSTDVIGVELGGALKNVIAIGVGVSDGLGFGDNTRAALITRGLAEMARLGIAVGAQAATFAGLSGMGDLIVTCCSELSRNRGVGLRIGQGESIEDILASMKQVAEGVWNCTAVRDLAREVGVETPITDEVCAIVHEGKNPRDAVSSLLTRSFKSE